MTTQIFGKRRIITNIIADIVQYMAQHRARQARVNAAYKQTVKELSDLTSRELADIGVRPYDIPAIARASAEQIQ